METLNDVLEDQVKDLYSAENQLLKALPKMAKAAATDKLRAAFESHLAETKGHVDRLVKVADTLGIKPSGKTCAAMKGLLEEGKEVLEEHGKGPVRDTALIAAAQRVEHYEIAAYGTVRAIAEHLQLKSVAKLFDQTIKEEGAADKKLTDVAMKAVYPTVPTSDDE